MNGKHDIASNDNVHDNYLHMLDAYSTHELDHAEQGDLEQHLTYCSDCQRLLAEIQQFRKLLAGSPANNSRMMWIKWLLLYHSTITHQSSLMPL